MGITVKVKRGVCYPCIICDICGKVIEDAKGANVLYKVFGDPDFIFVHKTESGNTVDSNWPYSDELDGWLVNLSFNCGITTAKAWKMATEKAVAISNI